MIFSVSFERYNEFDLHLFLWPLSDRVSSAPCSCDVFSDSFNPLRKPLLRFEFSANEALLLNEMEKRVKEDSKKTKMAKEEKKKNLMISTLKRGRGALLSDEGKAFKIKV